MRHRALARQTLEQSSLPLLVSQGLARLGNASSNPAGCQLRARNHIIRLSASRWHTGKSSNLSHLIYGLDLSGSGRADCTATMSTPQSCLASAALLYNIRRRISSMQTKPTLASSPTSRSTLLQITRTTIDIVDYLLAFNIQYSMLTEIAEIVEPDYLTINKGVREWRCIEVMMER